MFKYVSFTMVKFTKKYPKWPKRKIINEVEKFVAPFKGKYNITFLIPSVKVNKNKEKNQISFGCFLIFCQISCVLSIKFSIEIVQMLNNSVVFFNYHRK